MLLFERYDVVLLLFDHFFKLLDDHVLLFYLLLELGFIVFNNLVWTPLCLAHVLVFQQLVL